MTFKLLYTQDIKFQNSFTGYNKSMFVMKTQKRRCKYQKSRKKQTNELVQNERKCKTAFVIIITRLQKYVTPEHLPPRSSEPQAQGRPEEGSRVRSFSIPCPRDSLPEAEE